jgi:hypothetical protein
VHYDPKNERLNQYKVLSNPPENVLFNHTPVHELNLEHDEEFLVIKAKRRLLVIFSQEPAPWPSAGNRLRELGYVCLPAYSFHTPEDLPEFMTRVRAHEYPWWIHLPADSTVGLKEGFIRLDRMQLIEKQILQPIPVSLTPNALFFISEWLHFYLSGEIDSSFLQDRQELVQSLQQQA